jgi:subtilase family serine protease
VRARRLAVEAHLVGQEAPGVVAGDLAVGARGGGTNLTLDAGNAVASTGPWNDTLYPPPFAKTGGGGGQSRFEKRQWWQPAQSFASAKYRMVPDVAAFGDESPG